MREAMGRERSASRYSSDSSSKSCGGLEEEAVRLEEERGLSLGFRGARRRGGGARGAREMWEEKGDDPNGEDEEAGGGGGGVP